MVDSKMCTTLKMLHFFISRGETHWIVRHKMIVDFSTMTKIVIDARRELQSEAKAKEALEERPTFRLCTNFSKGSPMLLFFDDPYLMSPYLKL